MKLGKWISEYFRVFNMQILKSLKSSGHEMYKIPQKIYKILSSEGMFLQIDISVKPGRKQDKI